MKQIKGPLGEAGQFNVLSSAAVVDSADKIIISDPRAALQYKVAGVRHAEL